MQIRNRGTECQTKIDVSPCLESENILLDGGSSDHLSLDRTDWVRVQTIKVIDLSKWETVGLGV